MSFVSAAVVSVCWAAALVSLMVRFFGVAATCTLCCTEKDEDEDEDEDEHDDEDGDAESTVKVLVRVVWPVFFLNRKLSVLVADWDHTLLLPMFSSCRCAEGTDKFKG